MAQAIYALNLPLRFPAGIAPGEGSDYNVLTLARNGQEVPVLRGSALAGTLRHAWVRYLRGKGLAGDALQQEERRFFGHALESRKITVATNEDKQPEPQWSSSALQVGDSVIELGAAPVTTRTHHWRNRHTGVVMDGGLYSLECCPPGSSADAVLWLREPDEVEGPESTVTETKASVTEFFEALVRGFASGLTLGGSSARGIGRVELDRAAASYKKYNLADLDDYASYLDDHLGWRRTGQPVPSGQPFPETPRDGNASTLEIDVCFVIPRGQDILVGDGQGLDHEVEPQRITRADGTECWRLPGGSLRGIFRGWATRLAARDPRFADCPVVDDAQTYADLPADRKPKPPRIDTEHDRARYLACPVNRLFGSVFAAGRIHISDAEAACLPEITATFYQRDQPPVRRDVYPEEQLRMHVAVDRVTGGAAESMLFDNTVLTAGPDGRSPQFQVSIRIQDPVLHEVEWVVATLRALDLGILRVGSSKSSGRLSLHNVRVRPSDGDFARMFQGLTVADQAV